MKRLCSLALIVVLTALVGCRRPVDVPGGVVPEQYLSDVQKVVGDYIGGLDRGQPGILRLSLVEGNRLKAEFLDFQGRLVDLHDACTTRPEFIGKVEIGERRRVAVAYFDLVKSGCRRVEGRHLVLSLVYGPDFSTIRGFHAAIHEYTYSTGSGEDETTTRVYTRGYFGRNRTEGGL